MLVHSVLSLKMVFTQEQRIFATMSYLRNSSRREDDGPWVHDTRACYEEYREKFPAHVIVYRVFCIAVTRLVTKFMQTGSVERKAGSGTVKRVRTEANINAVRENIEATLTNSLRRMSQQTALSYGTCQRIIKKDLHLHPYKLQCFQELKPADYPRRVAYCAWFNEHLNNDDVLEKTFFSDEAWFHLSGYVNSQNYRMWGTDDPHFFVEAPLHPEKVGVFVAMSRNRLIGPIFFQQTVTAQFYQTHLLTPTFNQMQELELREGYFQQDGATAHTARTTMAFLRERFDDRVITTTTVWPARSPDLTPLDYFLFSYLKNSVFKQPMHTLEQLRARITEQCAQITPQILTNVFENMKRRVNLCLEVEGQHFQQLL